MTTDTPDAAPAAQKPTIVLIHGLWLTPLSWEGWGQRFESKGHTVLAPAWPGLEGTVEEVRRARPGPGLRPGPRRQAARAHRAALRRAR